MDVNPENLKFEVELEEGVTEVLPTCRPGVFLSFGNPPVLFTVENLYQIRQVWPDYDSAQSSAPPDYA
jgi:hypothetical protein